VEPDPEVEIERVVCHTFHPFSREDVSHSQKATAKLEANPSLERHANFLFEVNTHAACKIVPQIDGQGCQLTS
jgi:hypothetical protein